MRATDLMIGDWLYYRGKFNAFPFKVEQITRKKVGYHPDPYSNVMSYLRLNEEIAFIPLTPMILTDNGFKEYRPGHYRWDYAEGVYINADFTEEEPWAHISNRCYSATPVCRYVHEFQHALKLCGIEKKIIL